MTSKSPDNSAVHEAETEIAVEPAHALNAQPIDAGLEVAPASEHDKQFVNRAMEGDKEPINHGEKEVISFHQPVQHSNVKGSLANGRLCGLKRRFFWSLMAILLLAIALGVGLGVGLSSQKSSEPSSTANSPPSSSPTQGPSSPTAISNELKIGGSIDDSYYSQSGAWNGSGIAQIWQNFGQNFTDTPTNNDDQVVMYYQYHSGEIRWLRETANTTQIWQPGPIDVAVVASDAKNSTSITAVHYNNGSRSEWHLFYIDSNNRIRQRSGNNQTILWETGSIDRMELEAWHGDLVGLQVCWATNLSIPMRVFYASNETTFEEYLWFAEEETWKWQQSWHGYSGAAGIGCLIGVEDYRYVAMVNLDNQLEFWYQDKRDDGFSAKWLKASNNVLNVHSASSVALTNLVAVWQEKTSNQIIVASMKWLDQNTRQGDRYSLGGDLTSLSGAHFDSLTRRDVVNVFYQSVGGEVVELTRNLSDDRGWSQKILPV